MINNKLGAVPEAAKVTVSS